MSAFDASLPMPVGVEGAAMRDAESIASRIGADELAADEARQAYQAGGLPALEPDAGAIAILQPGETLHAIRPSTMLEETGSINGMGRPRGGTLYLTSQRLVHAGVESTELALGEIEEMAIALERLVLIRVRNGSDLALEVDQPRLLRVQVAAAIGAGRARSAPQP